MLGKYSPCINTYYISRKSAYFWRVGSPILTGRGYSSRGINGEKGEIKGMTGLILVTLVSF
jgi:hypothetical protein